MPAAALHHASPYLAAGLRIFPLHRPVRTEHGWACSCGKPGCDSPAKHPVAHLAPNGLNSASNDPTVVAGWFTGASWNVGLVTGQPNGFIVLDIDPAHDGDNSLAALEREHGPLPPTWRFLTGGGGAHILFRHPGGRVPNSAGKVGAGVDVRGDGGYIVAPPSLHMSGRPYVISVDHHPNDTPLADAPNWLINLIRVGGENGSASRAEWRHKPGTTVGEGERNDTLSRLSGVLLGRGLGPHLVLDLMLAYNAQYFAPPLIENEVIRTVASIASRELSRRAERTCNV